MISHLVVVLTSVPEERAGMIPVDNGGTLPFSYLNSLKQPTAVSYFALHCLSSYFLTVFGSVF